MDAIALPALYAIFLWWFATGAIVYLDGLPSRTFGRSLSVGTGLFAVASVAAMAVSGSDTAIATLVGFTAGLVIWAWHELTFYTGWITGPRRTGCHTGCRGPKHFKHAVLAIAWHQIAIAVSVAALWLATHNGVNQTALWTVLLLWAMQLSAKLNVFLGVRNLSTHLLPEHMQYLRSYMRIGRPGVVMALALVAGSMLTLWLAQSAWSAPAASADRMHYALLATLACLGTLEHLFLVLPRPLSGLWSWAAHTRAERPASTPRDAGMPTSENVAHARLTASGTSVTLSENVSAPISRSCDAANLLRLLDHVSAGAYGSISRLEGVARSGDSWIRFDVAGGGTSKISEITPHAGAEGRFTAFGRKIDLERLNRAFYACAEKAVA